MKPEAKPYAYSLGPPELFDRLAELARRHRCWRKVANLTYRMHLTVSPRHFFCFDAVGDKQRNTATFLQAMRDTKVPAIIKIELSKIWRELILK
jgi:hypothetical protein